ncbi:MAG: hypothetical protein K6B70_04705 [Clostridia bacterium]|nr:hypothetical protein [Clostridia bacterium]
MCKNYLIVLGSIINKKVIKPFLFIIMLFVTAIQLSGCYDARGIEDLAYVTALGIDIAENNTLALTFQISIPESSSSSGSGSSQSSKSENTTIQCNSINSGISLANSYISKQINLSHCKVIVFSEKIASKGLNEYIDTLSNNIEIRPNCNVIISRGTAKDFIENAKPSIETLTARYYEVALKSNDYTGYTTSTEFATFVNDIKNSFVEASAILGGINNGKNIAKNNSLIDSNYVAGETPIKSGNKQEKTGGDSDNNKPGSGENGNTNSSKPSNEKTENSGIVELDDKESANNMETFGTAVFHSDKFVGELTGFETLCFLLLTDKFESCTVSVPNPLSNTNNENTIKQDQSSQGTETNADQTTLSKETSAKSSQIDLIITESKKSKIKVDTSGGTPNITIDLFLEAHGLTLNDTIDYTSIQDVAALENSAKQFLNDKISIFLYKTSKEYNSDIVGFGKYALSKYLTWDDWQKSNWTENYKNANFNVNVNLNILSGEEFDKSP